MLFDGVATYCINGSTIRNHIECTISDLNKKYSGIQSLKKYGIRNRRKLKEYALIKYQHSLLYGFIFQFYINITTDLKELTEMYKFCFRNKLYILANFIKLAINIVDSSEDLEKFLINRIIWLELYMRSLLFHNNNIFKDMIFIKDTGSLFIKTADINALLLAK